MKSRNAVVSLVNSWVGKNEKDGSFKEIIDIYNSYNKPARGIKMQYNWAWCACTWSALAIRLGYTDIMPVEISCGFLIDEANKMGCWEESDLYIPQAGDACLYDWNDSGNGDNTGWPDHVGTVTYTNKDSGYFVVTEGNYQDSVKKRTVSINGKFIRGFIVPKYDKDESVFIPFDDGKKTISDLAHEVIAGMWGNGDERKRRISEYLYGRKETYEDVRKEVNRILNGSAYVTDNKEQDTNQPYDKSITATCVARKFDKKHAGTYDTTTNLYLRNDAGTNKKALCVIPKGTKIKCFGYYNLFNGVIWPLIEVKIDGVKYTGFSSSTYLRKL